MRSRHPERWGQVALMLAAFALLAAVYLYFHATTIRNDARKENCQNVETKHLEEIKNLQRAYDIFLHPPEELRLYITRDPRAVMDLRRLERDARNDQDAYGEFVPSYCDAPGYGRDEPDPRMPHKPAGVP